MCAVTFHLRHTCVPGVCSRVDTYPTCGETREQKILLHKQPAADNA